MYQPLFGGVFFYLSGKKNTVKKIKRYLLERDRIWILGLLLFTCMLYLPFLNSPLFFDDFNLFDDKFLSHYVGADAHFGLRWLPNISIVWTYLLVDNEFTHLYRLASLLLHAGSVIALFFLIRMLLSYTMKEKLPASAAHWAAWLGALLFAAHPVAVYATGYIAQRSILMATLFSLLMQLAYIRGLMSGKHIWLVLTVIAYALAVFSKEHSVLAPALLAAETILLRTDIRAGNRALFFTWLGLIVVGINTILMAKGVIGTPYEADSASMFASQQLDVSRPVLHLLSVLTQAGLFFKYFLLMVLPNPAWMSIDMREMFITSLGVWQGWLGLLAFFATGAVAIRLLFIPRMAGLLGLAMFYVWGQFLLEFSSIRIQEIFVIYRSYLWLPGIILGYAIIYARWPNRKTLVLALLLVVVMMSVSYNRLWVMSDNYRLWKDAAMLLQTGKEPLASRIYYNLANAEAKNGRWPEAVKHYELTISLWKTESAVLRHDLGAAYFNVGRYEDALTQFDKSLALDPDYAKAYFDQALTLKYLHQEKRALEQMQKSCDLKYSIACMLVKMSGTKK